MIEFLIVAAYLLVGYFVVGTLKEDLRKPFTVLLVSLLWPFVLACVAGILVRDWSGVDK